MLEIIKPQVTVEEVSTNRARFVVEPLERGYGYTLGNTLRRILLSSIPGAAIATVKIDGVAHEFSTIQGMREDVSELLLNLKQVSLRLNSEQPATIRLKAKGPKEVKASDLQLPSEVEVIDPEQHIAVLNNDGDINMEMQVELGRGFETADQDKGESSVVGVIPIDRVYSPIRKVNYNVRNTRVGQRTDYDKLILEIETNGALTAKEAIAAAARINSEHMNLFENGSEAAGRVFQMDTDERDTLLSTPISALELTQRSHNCLVRANISVLGDLAKMDEKELKEIKNLGEKSLNEIKEKLASFGIHLTSEEQ